MTAAASGALTFQSVDAGGGHSCGLTTAGAAYCWGGQAEKGELGNGTNTISSVPVPVSGGHTFQSVSAGNSHSCGLTTVGAAFCWGWNGTGQLGNGTNTESNVPVAVFGGHTFQSVSAGQRHSCGVTTTGATFCWGENSIGGQLGDGTNTNSNVPVAVSGGHTFQSVSAGQRHSCGLTTVGAAFCWGWNGTGQLGNGTNTESNVPVAVFGGHTFQSVSANGQFSCGLTTTGLAYCWGRNVNGELGDGTNTNSNVPVAVSGGHTFQSQSVNADGNHSCAVATGGAAYCWGMNTWGQLGNGTNTDGNVPVAVSGGLTFQTVNTGNSHSCGVTTVGAAFCWGWNEEVGVLGDGTTTNRSVPVALQAQPLTFNSAGEVTGVVELEVASTLYNVSFVGGTYNEQFGGSFDFAGEAAAKDARDTLNAILNSQIPISAVLDGGFLQFLIPYDNPSDTTGSLFSAPGRNTSGTWDPYGIVLHPNPVSVPGQGVVAPGDALISLEGAIWARFSPSITPGTLLEQLGTAVAGVGPGKSLADKVVRAQTYLAVPDVQATCAVLTGFVNQVRAQRGKKLTPDVADQLTEDAVVIMDLVGCN